MSAPNPGEINPDEPVDRVKGIGEARSEALRDAGYETVADLRAASVEELSQILPANVAAEVKEQVGRAGPMTTVAEAKSRAQEVPGAMAKVVRVDGRQRPKVLRKVQERREAGATVTIHKG